MHIYAFYCYMYKNGFLFKEKSSKLSKITKCQELVMNRTFDLFFK